VEERNDPQDEIAEREPSPERDEAQGGDFEPAKLSDEDPTFRVSGDSETGQTLISGMGELHLEVIIDRLRREFGVQASVGAPQVAYRGTITREADAEGRFVRQTGGRGQYGHVVLHAAPGQRGSGVEFINAIVGGAIPGEFIPSVKQGVLGALTSGPHGYQMTDIQVSLTDGSFHQVDSSEIAFQMAGSIAVREALLKAGSVVLQPVMEVEVVAPDIYMGEIVANVNSKRADIESAISDGSEVVVKAWVPLANMFGYAGDLRSLTQGRGTFTMEFSHYQQVGAGSAQSALAKT